MPFEIGPIRPPSEAYSLLVRVTRNCPWNQCCFCPVYKGTRFSIRTVEEVKQDIQEMGRVAETLREISWRMGWGGEIKLGVLKAMPASLVSSKQVAIFLARGGERAFLQDANSLVMPAESLAKILNSLRGKFPSLKRITTYARSHTLTKRTLTELTMIREAGLSRVHVGLESGSDEVLTLIRKGVDGKRHIEAGLRAKEAGFELSEYVMPGLGGKQFSKEHALASAKVLSAINPHYLRLRTTAVAPGTVFSEMVASGKIEPMDDEEIVSEIKLFLEHLKVTSRIQSDHVLNLLPELEGQFPDDKQRLLDIIDRFQHLEPLLRKAFILGRRAGIISGISEMEQKDAQERALQFFNEVDARYQGDTKSVIQNFMSRFI